MEASAQARRTPKQRERRRGLADASIAASTPVTGAAIAAPAAALAMLDDHPKAETWTTTMFRDYIDRGGIG